mmetsp:Transcript_20007/g.40428  ORF Transcript_20007/g.40428 Transcript_20007/m.40428 type:complete len:269 (-) Transcript_20007:711-1517(-)
MYFCLMAFGIPKRLQKSLITPEWRAMPFPRTLPTNCSPKSAYPMSTAQAKIPVVSCSAMGSFSFFLRGFLVLFLISGELIVGRASERDLAIDFTTSRLLNCTAFSAVPLDRYSNPPADVILPAVASSTMEVLQLLHLTVWAVGVFGPKKAFTSVSQHGQSPLRISGLSSLRYLMIVPVMPAPTSPAVGTPNLAEDTTPVGPPRMKDKNNHAPIDTVCGTSPRAPYICTTSWTSLRSWSVVSERVHMRSLPCRQTSTPRLRISSENSSN